MNVAQRAALRALVHRLLPRLGRDGLLDLLYCRMTEQRGLPVPARPAGPCSEVAADETVASLLADQALDPLWAQPETLGWAHQYAQDEAKAQAFERLLKRGEKVKASALAAVTQLFTPAWIVRFLVENSLGRLWLEMHPDSSLGEELPWLLPEARAQTGAGVSPAHRGEQPRLAREIRVLDPACGAMHFGLAAYDLLARCYAEELARAGEPGWPERPSVDSVAAIPAAILQQNLYGLEIDPAVLEVARRTLRLKAGAEPVNLICLPAPLGALDRAAGPEGPFHVVLTNPPYLARRHMDAALAAYLAAAYPEGKGDLYTAFLQRCLEWLAPGGRLGMIAQSSFMFIGSYEALRQRLLEQTAIEAVAHFGPGAFAEIAGEKVNTAAFLLRREEDPDRRAASVGVYFRLLDGGEEEKREALAAAVDALQVARQAAPQPPRDTALGERVYRTPQAAYRSLPGAPWVYWLPPELRAWYREGERLGDRARFCRGITTAANRRFVRYWWEVGLEAIDFGCRSVDEAARSAKRWFPYMKGGGPVRWFGNIRHVIDWADGGRSLRAFPRAAVRNLPFQFREGITYSAVTGGTVTARLMPGGFLFDQASNAIFPHDPADGPVLLALLNHPIAAFTAGFNPTVNIVEADLNRIPWPRVDRGEVNRAVARCIELARRIDAMDERSPYFRQPPLPDQSDLLDLTRRLAEQEAVVEGLIDDGLTLSRSAREAIRERLKPVPPVRYSPSALAEAWVSYALSILLGRCRPGGYGGGELLTRSWSDLASLVQPSGALPVARAAELVRQVLEVLLDDPGRLGIGDLERYLETTFLQRHGRTYRGRPAFRLDGGILRAGASDPSPVG